MGLFDTFIICVVLWIPTLISIVLISIIRNKEIDLQTLLNSIKTSKKRKNDKAKKTSDKPKKTKRITFFQIIKNVIEDLKELDRTYDEQLQLKPQSKTKPQEESKPQKPPEPQMYPISRKSSVPQTPMFEPGAKGEMGEYLVASRLRETRSEAKKIINNIVIKTSDGRTSQIDHILINEFGIFVVETKNYSGNVYGGLTHQNWLQYVGDRKESFYNPVMQNETHIKRLREVLCIEHLYQYKIYSIVVFVQNNANKIDIANVINLSDLIPYINSFNVKTMTTNEIESIYHQLLTIKNQNYVHHL